MKYFAVIDTNVIVSAMLKNDFMPAQVLKEVLLGNINMLVNEDIFDVMIKYCDKVSDKLLEDFVEEHKELYGEDLDFTQARVSFSKKRGNGFWFR